VWLVYYVVDVWTVDCRRNYIGSARNNYLYLDDNISITSILVEYAAAECAEEKLVHDVGFKSTLDCLNNKIWPVGRNCL
jgi:hypothetical protein